MDPTIEFYKAAFSKNGNGFDFPVFREHPGINMARVLAMFFAA